VANLAVTFGVLWFGRRIIGLLGKAGAKVLSKVANLLLAAFAVMMIRMGIADIIRCLQEAV